VETVSSRRGNCQFPARNKQLPARNKQLPLWELVGNKLFRSVIKGQREAVLLVRRSAFGAFLRKEGFFEVSKRARSTSRKVVLQPIKDVFCPKNV